MAVTLFQPDKKYTNQVVTKPNQPIGPGGNYQTYGAGTGKPMTPVGGNTFQNPVTGQTQPKPQFSKTLKPVGTIPTGPLTNPGTPTAPTAPAFDPEAYAKQFTDQINNMFNQQRAAQLAQLQAQRDKAIGQINQQKAELKPMYQGMKNQTDVVNLQNVQKLRELMAANGLSATGENISANVAANNERLNSINSLNLQEQQQVNDFNRRISDLNNPADENALMAQLEAERSRALLEMGMRADEIGYGRGRDKEMDSRYYDERNYSRQWNENDRSYSRGRDAESDKRYYDERDYTRTRDEKEWQASEQQRRIENDWRRYTFNNMSASEKAQLKQNADQFGEDMAWRMYEMEYNGNLNKSMSEAELAAIGGFNGVEGGGGASASAGTDSYKKNLGVAQQKYGIPNDAIPYINWIIQRESSFNPTAQNKTSSAYGYGQFIDSTREAYEKKYGVSYDDPANQIYLTYRYMVDRYGSPQKAVDHWKKNNWY